MAKQKTVSAKAQATDEQVLDMYHDKILIKKIDVEVRTESGIIMGSDVEKDRETGYGKVLSVGPGKQIDTLGLLPMKTQVGDIVAFNERIPRQIYYLGNAYYILRETDVDGRIPNTSDIIEKPFELEGYEYDATIARHM